MGAPSRLVALAALLAASCRDPSCLDGRCTRPCAELAFPCAGAPVLYAGPLGQAPAQLRLEGGNGGARDIMISNGRVTAVIGALDAPIDLAPTGGNLIDFGPAGGRDDITLTYQIAGILPDDAFAYRTLDVATRGDAVTVTVRGALDGRPEVGVVTHYELAGCDPGLRVRSELFNGSADKQAFVVADAMHWGKRRVVPFAPAPGQGLSQPELDLLELSALWSPFAFGAAATPDGNAGSYAAVACSARELHGVNDLEISALGTPMTHVAPGDSLVLERLLIAAGNGGTAPAIDHAVLAHAQLFGGATREVTGRVVAGGRPLGGDVRRASVVIASDGRPATWVVPAADGTFRAVVPAGAITAEVWSFGRNVAEARGEALGDLEVPEPGTVQLAVTRNSGAATEPAWAMAVFVPDDDATRADVTGTFHGRLGACAPWLGPPNGASPACNQVIVAPRGTDVEVPAGRYRVLAVAGPAHTLAARTIEVRAGEIVAVALEVTALALVPAGWLSADLHVHGRASFDSGIPDDDRVRTFVASGVDVIAATDHDVIGDYTQTVAALGLDDRVAVMGGLEATQLIPWLDVPGATLPRVIGHFNFWPLQRLPSEPRAGAPWDEGIEPGALFDRMAPLVGDGGMMMLNHPWGDPLFGRDTGYLRAIDFDPRVPIDDQPMLLRRPAGGRANLDWNLIEIINGADASELIQARVLWHSLLAQGVIVPGAGNSDSHGLVDEKLGWARNWVQASTQVVGFSAEVLDAAIRDGRMIAGNGVVVLVEIVGAAGRRGLGFAPHRAQPGDMLDITVNAPPWIPVTEIRVVTSRGTRVLASDVPNPDPLSAGGVTRYTTRLALADLVDRDDFVIVEAGLPYPLVADLDDDGVPDTSDNNGDGVVDAADVEDGEDVGPLAMPADPTDPSDLRFWFTRVVPGAWPAGFANPVLIDLDGGGWTPPGVAR